MNRKPTNARHAGSGAGIAAVRLLMLVGLLLLPMIALHRRGVEFQWVAIYGLVLNALTYWVYAIDKQRAEQGEWRVSEAALHLLELLGGWPGAWLAQRRLRHKCSKGSYQVEFWLIVLTYQFLAIDSFLNWQFSHMALNWLDRRHGR